MLPSVCVCTLYLRVHECEDATHLMSLDFERHMERLPEQQDALDLLMLPEAHFEEPDESEESEELGVSEESEESEESCESPVQLGAQVAAPPSSRPARMRYTLLTDALIFKFVDVHGPRWRDLSRSLGGRALGYGDDALRNRYGRICEAMGIPYGSPRKRPDAKTTRKNALPSERWTEEEDQLIQECIHVMGFKWNKIAKQFVGRRTKHAVRNRANRLGMCGSDEAASPNGAQAGF